VPGENYAFSYNILSDGSAEVYGFTGTLPDALTVPAQVDGYSVTVLSLDLSSAPVKSLTVSEGIRTVRLSGAGSALSAMVLPGSMTSFEISVGANYPNLTDLTVSPGSAYTASNGILCKDSQATLVWWPSASGSITVADGVTEIGAGAFSGTQVQAAVLPLSVASVDNSAFSGCSALTDLTVSYAYAVLGSGIMPAAAKLHGYTGSTAQSYASQNGIPFVDMGAIPADQPLPVCRNVQYSGYTTTINGQQYYCITDILSADSLNGILQIPAAYNGLPVRSVALSYFPTNSIYRVEIPEGIAGVYGGFSYAEKLTSVSLPSTLSELGNGAFNGCATLTDITIAAGSSYTAAGGIVYNKNGTHLVAWPSASGNITVPSGVTVIETSAFLGNSAVTGVSLPEGLLAIGDNAFNGCPLTVLTLPQNLRSIGGCAFTGGKFSAVSLPQSVIYVGSGAFSNTSLTDLTVPNARTVFDGSISGQLPAGVTVHGYAGSSAQDYAALEGAAFASLGDVPAGQTQPAADNVQYTCYDTTYDGQNGVVLNGITLSDSYGELTLPATYNGKAVLGISLYTISGSGVITSLVIPEGVRQISGYFDGLRTLRSVAIPSTVRDISGGLPVQLQSSEGYLDRGGFAVYRCKRRDLRRRRQNAGQLAGRLGRRHGARRHHEDRRLRLCKPQRNDRDHAAGGRGVHRQRCVRRLQRADLRCSAFHSENDQLGVVPRLLEPKGDYSAGGAANHRFQCIRL
jgi:hypothetical protein